MMGSWWQTSIRAPISRTVLQILQILPNTKSAAGERSRPDYANVEVDGKLEKVDPDEVAVGTEITVNPGEKIPIDGIVTSGDTSLNTSALTGESLPRNVKTGDEVISGCINMTGVIKVKTTKEFGDSTVSKILDLVENSSMKKSRSENFITKFARYYPPAVCFSALALAI